VLLAYRLVKLIETHSDGLARSLHNRYRECSKCSAYANVPESELIEKVYEVYRHLGEWLLGKTEADVERRYLEIGAQRAAQGVPISQVVWMICLVRENLWDYLQKHAELERPAKSSASSNCWRCSTSSSILPFTTRRWVTNARLPATR